MSTWRHVPAWGSRVGSLVLLIVYGFPLYWLVATSFKTNVEIFADPAGIVFSPSTSAYHRVLNASLAHAALNSGIIAVCTTALTLALGVPAAYGLARTRTVLLPVGLGSLILLQMIPPTASVIPLYKVLAGWNLLGTLAGVIIADSAMLIPFAVLLLRPFFQTIPEVMEEAAAVDGASRLRTFVTILLPLARNGIATVGTLIFIIAWGEFLYAISFLTNPEAYPISAVISQQVSAYGIDWPGLMALATVTSIPVLVLFAATQRRLAEGLSLGSVK